jgi:hypothetical protein
MSRLSAAIAFASLAAAAAPAASQCGPGAGGCFEVNETPGCMQAECCGLVCEADSFCCTSAWDEFCVELAAGLCEGLVCPNTGPCFEAHASVGCIDAACCSLVTALDPWCRSIAWDSICARRAIELCGVPACELAIPANARSEEEACYDRLNDGCSPTGAGFGSLACGETVAGKWTSGPSRDLDWHRLDPGIASVRFRAEFPAVVQLIAGRCDGTLEVLAEAAIGPCGEVEFEVPAGVADLHAVISGGTVEGPFRSAFACDEIDPDNPPEPDAPPPPPAPFGRRYLVEGRCDCPAADFDGDCRVGGSDLAIMLVNWGGAGPTDLDGNGLTDGGDLAQLLAAWSLPEG